MAIYEAFLDLFGPFQTLRDLGVFGVQVGARIDALGGRGDGSFNEIVGSRAMGGGRRYCPALRAYYSSREWFSSS